MAAAKGLGYTEDASDSKMKERMQSWKKLQQRKGADLGV